MPEHPHRVVAPHAVLGWGSLGQAVCRPRAGRAELLDITGEVSADVAHGPLVLEPDALRVEGSGWLVPHSQVSTMHVYMQRRLMIRAGDRLWEAEIPTGSVVRWQWEVEARMAAG